MSPCVALALVICWAGVNLARADIGGDNACALEIFVPFTNNGTTAVSVGNEDVVPGFAHMTAALLAMQDFNSRNTSVVAQLADYADCPIQFDISNSQFFDTGSVGHLAAKTFARTSFVPCAIAGPFNDMPALDLGTMAEAYQFPLVVHRAFNMRVIDPTYSDYSSQVYPDVAESTEAMLSFLREIGRTNYMAILHPMSDTGMLSRQVIAFYLEEYNIQWYSGHYMVPGEENWQDANTVYSALSNLKERGFNTIIVTCEDPFSEVPGIAHAADQLGMNNGDHFWIWFGTFYMKYVFNPDPRMKKLLYGSAWIAAVDMFTFNDTNAQKLPNALASQNATFIDKLNAANPIEKGDPGFYFAGPDYLADRNQSVAYGQGFMYDAVMSIGMGACRARRAKNNTIMSLDHVEGIRKVSFDGASGIVSFGGIGFPGARSPATAVWSAFNFHPDNPKGDASTPYLRLPGDPTWRKLEPFIYRLGPQKPPPLRKQPAQNYLSPQIRVLGFVFLGTVLLAAAVAAVWVYLNRKHQVLRASQPTFLYFIAFGSSVFATAIFTMSFDESYGWTERQLSMSCMATPWLVASGYTITFGALFAKLFRVNKLLQFQRSSMDIKRAMRPAIFFLALNVIVLALWTAIDPLQWRRVETNQVTGASIGGCHNNNFWAFCAPLAVVMILPMSQTGWMAWRTRDVDVAYSESLWIFSLIIVQLEASLVGLPVLVILREVSSSGRYIGFVTILWIFPMSTLVLIMLPKVLAYIKAKRGIVTPQQRRGERAGTRVSGITLSMPSEGYMHSQPFPASVPAGNGVSANRMSAVTFADQLVSGKKSSSTMDGKSISTIQSAGGKSGTGSSAALSHYVVAPIPESTEEIELPSDESITSARSENGASSKTNWEGRLANGSHICAACGAAGISVANPVESVPTGLPEEIAVDDSTYRFL